jgi:hypothetical protein
MRAEKLDSYNQNSSIIPDRPLKSSAALAPHTATNFIDQYTNTRCRAIRTVPRPAISAVATAGIENDSSWNATARGIGSATRASGSTKRTTMYTAAAGRLLVLHDGLARTTMTSSTRAADETLTTTNHHASVAHPRQAVELFLRKRGRGRSCAVLRQLHSAGQPGLVRYL